MPQMRRKIEPCKGCGVQSELRYSHIIPEWAFRSVYTKKHKFATVGAHETGRLDPKQKGLREPLLCGKCETYLSKLENLLYTDVRSIRAGIRQVALRDGMVVAFAQKTVPSYANFKRAVLSILWRMSVSTRTEFRNYALPEYESQLRHYIFDRNAVLPWNSYPIVVFRLTIGEKLDNGIMMLFPPIDLTESIFIQSFAIYGVQFNVYIDKSSSTNQTIAEISALETVALRESGSLLVADLEVVQMIRRGRLFGRLLSADVRSFYKRYS